MRYINIDKCECNNGLGIGVSVYFQGCSLKCKGCFNPETWNFEEGKLFSFDVEEYILKLLEPSYISRLTLTGGNPLEKRNYEQLLRFILLVKIFYPEKKIWIYTGFTLEELLEQQNPYLNQILQNIDVLIDGQFQEDKKDLTYPFAGSTNQRIIDMPQTLKQNKIILFDL